MSLQQQSTSTAQPVHGGLLPPPFHCSISHRGVLAVWVEASGELDLLTAPELKRTLREAATVARLTVLDLHALTFIDSSGIHVIEDAGLDALLHDRRLVVSSAPAQVIRIMALTGTNGTIDVLETPAEQPQPLHWVQDVSPTA